MTATITAAVRRFNTSIRGNTLMVTINGANIPVRRQRVYRDAAAVKLVVGCGEVLSSSERQAILSTFDRTPQPLDNDLYRRNK